MVILKIFVYLYNSLSINKINNKVVEEEKLKREIEELRRSLIMEVRKVIVFDTLDYLSTQEYIIDGPSKYYIFGAFNKELNRLQKVTYSVYDKCIYYTLHPQVLTK